MVPRPPVCAQCGRPASYIAFNPLPEKADRVVATCGDCDPYGDRFGEFFTLAEVQEWLDAGNRSAFERAGHVSADVARWLQEISEPPQTEQTPKPSEKGAYNLQEAAAYVGMGRDAFRENVVQAGEIKVIYAGGRKMIAKAELDRWLGESGEKVR